MMKTQKEDRAMGDRAEVTRADRATDWRTQGSAQYLHHPPRGYWERPCGGICLVRSRKCDDHDADRICELCSSDLLGCVDGTGTDLNSAGSVGEWSWSNNGGILPIRSLWDIKHSDDNKSMYLLFKKNFLDEIRYIKSLFVTIFNDSNKPHPYLCSSRRVKAAGIYKKVLSGGQPEHSEGFSRDIHTEVRTPWERRQEHGHFGTQP